MLASAQNYYTVAWWYLVFPALALLITTLAFNLLGDGIRDALDPRTERVFAGRRRRRIRAIKSPARMTEADLPGGDLPTDDLPTLPGETGA
jgi:peptide/nickel transport system permease protein